MLVLVAHPGGSGSGLDAGWTSIMAEKWLAEADYGGKPTEKLFEQEAFTNQHEPGSDGC